MEYNNYYPAQQGHPPSHVSNQQLGGPQLQQQQQQQQPHPGNQMMHAHMPPQNIRQPMPPGPPSHQHHHHHQSMSQQHQPHLGHHSQPMSQQPQHANYHQVQAPHPQGSQISHSGSPHLQQSVPQQQQPQQQHLHNHQPSLTGQPPQQSALPSQQHQHHHHMHSQSPHHHGGPPMHMQQPQQLNQMVRPQMGPSVMVHPQSGLQQPPHNQNFFSGGPMPQSNVHHFQQNQHHPHPHHQQQHHQPQIIHHAPPLVPHHPNFQQGISRNSPYYPSLLQTEFRIIELNRRLQCRPISRQPASPLPNSPYDESLWWEKFASEFFEDDATLTLRVDDKTAEYTIGRALIPRFFRTYFDGGVTDLSINLRNPKEACTHPQLVTLDCDQTFIVTNNLFKNPGMPGPQNVIVHTEGHLILDFVNSFDTLTIKSWKFYTKGCREYIDRSMTTMGLPSSFLIEPLTKQGLTKSTNLYLKMCMIMEPMQDLMFQHRLTKMDPRSCLRKFLVDRFKYRISDDNRGATNKRRKRKPSATPAVTGASTNKKSKANVNNPISGNSGLNSNMMMSPGGPGFSLASQDVMVVGEPTMMGGDFGDDNERMIIRLENNQYDPAALIPLNTEEMDAANTSTGNDSGISNSNIESNAESHTLSSPPLPQQPPQHQEMPPPLSGELAPLDEQNASDQNPEHQEATQSDTRQLDVQEPNEQEKKHEPQPQSEQLESQAETQDQQIEVPSSDDLSQQPEQPPHEQEHQPKQDDPQEPKEENQSQQPDVEVQPTKDEGQFDEVKNTENSEHDQPAQVKEELVKEQLTNESGSEELPHLDGIPNQNEVHHEIKTETSVDNDDSLMIGVNSVDRMENHTDTIQQLNEMSDSNQLPCSTTTATPTIEQQQPVDNGVA